MFQQHVYIPPNNKVFGCQRKPSESHPSSAMFKRQSLLRPSLSQISFYHSTNISFGFRSSTFTCSPKLICTAWGGGRSKTKQIKWMVAHFIWKVKDRLRKRAMLSKKNPTSFPWPILSLFFKLEIRKAYTYECGVPSKFTYKCAYTNLLICKQLHVYLRWI